MLTRPVFSGNVYCKELLFPVTKNLLQDSREQHHCLINIHIFDYPDSQLSGIFTQVSTSPDNRGLTVHKKRQLFKRRFKSWQGNIFRGPILKLERLTIDNSALTVIYAKKSCNKSEK